jgi:subtilisin-like proprotein convertase family protein
MRFFPSRFAPLVAAAIWMSAGVLSPTPGSAATFSNPASIAIPVTGNATPYPSIIAVSGLGPGVVDVKATLSGFSHTFPGDVDILLVSPAGESVLLMSDDPAGEPYCPNNAVGLNLTFDDAAGPIPPAATLASGTYQPTNNDVSPSACGEATDAFAAPAPGGPYGSRLAVFNSRNPNGAWSLYVVDDSMGDDGSIANGWSLDIKLSNVFTLGAISRNKKKGTATLKVNVPNPGELALSGKGLTTARAAGAVVAKTVPTAGEVKLLIRARGKKKRRLNETGKVKVKPTITYTPTGGDPSTQSRDLKLKKR